MADALKLLKATLEGTATEPYYAKAEFFGRSDMNERYRQVIDYFHAHKSAPVQLQITTDPICPNDKSQSADGRGAEHERPGTFRWVEARIPGAFRVDGVCSECKYEMHRAGWLDAAARAKAVRERKGR